ncbi:unnamed protein product [Schistosoma rodhaini]|uniref:Uncharacterized protein n=2 Tax=Schistosoma rodhaini TaxID=6188 RepID=A0AA85G2S7_9TREM|nr:unnamed protein product [Schistosoma rodhaini]CAH8596896.1 unnamed protein product [Schistosoma rodhaini]
MDRSILTMSSNNTISPNCLKLVKASSDDRDARIISSRMGMTVPEFMNVLGYSNTTEQNISNSSSLIWPKHTELEVRDPWSSVYQYEPTDVSWCIRFKALGCYNFVPPPFVNHQHKVPTTPIPVPDFNKNTPKTDQVSPGSRTIHTHQKICTSEKSNVPSETITLAERHKLWEDLLLSDSEEENEEKPRLRTSSRTIAVETPVDNGDMLIKPGDKNTAESLSILNHALRPPPPFVSPLSILNGDGSGTESPIPNTHNGFMDLAQIDVSKQDSLDSKMSGCASEVPTECVVSKSENPMYLSGSRPSPLTTENPLRKHYPEDLRTSVPINSSSDNNNNFSSRLTTVTSTTTPKLTIQKPIPVLNDKPNSNHDVLIKPRTDTVTNRANEYFIEHCKGLETKKSFIQRLLLESGQFLTQKDCLITELSPIHHNDLINIPTKPSQAIEEKSVFTEQESEKVTNSPNVNRTPSDDSNSKINFKSSHQECTRSDGKNVTPEKSKTMGHQSLFHSNRRKDVEKVDTRTEDKTSKLNSVSVTQEGSNESPVSRNCLSSLSCPVDEYIPPTKNLISGMAKPIDTLKKELNRSYVNEITEKKTGINEVQTLITDMDKSHSYMNSSSSMPPPTHDSTGKKLKRRSKCSSKLTISKESVTTSSSELSTHEQSQNDSDMKKDINVPLVQNTVGIYPLRDIPSDCWIFSDLTVTKVRNKIQQSFSRTSNSSPKNEEFPIGFSSSDYHLIKKMRYILRGAVENDSPVISRTNESRRTRPRSLTGILLVPPPSFTASSETEQSSHLADEPSSHKGYHDIYTMTSPHLSRTTILNDVDVQCDIWPSSSNNNLISSRFVSQSSVGIISTPTQKPLGTVPPILRDPVCDLTNLSSNIAQNLPQLGGQSLPCMNLSDSLLFIEEQFGRIIKQENEKLQDSNPSSEIFKAEECKFEASKCWKALVSAISSCSRDNSSSEVPNRSQMLLNLQPLHEYPVQMTKSVKHYLAAAYIFESKSEILRAIDMLTEAANQIQHCVRRMHRVEAKLTKRRSHRTEVGNSPDTNELTVKAKRDASWMYLWYYVLMRIKAAVGFHTYRLRLQSIDNLREEINANLSVVKQHIPNLNDNICLPKVSDSPSSSKPSSIKSKVTSNSSSESENLKMLESLVVQFSRFNQLTSCVYSAMIEWQQADELVTKVPHLKSPIGRKSEGSTDTAGYTSFSGHLRPIHSIDIDIASSSEGAFINTSQIPILILLRYMDGIFHVHPLIIDQLKYPSGQESAQSISLKNNSSSEIQNLSTVSQEQKFLTSNFTLITDSVPLSDTISSTVSRTPNKQQQPPNNSAQSKFENTAANNVNCHSEPPSTHGISERLLKKKSHKKHFSDANPSPSLVSSSVAKQLSLHHSSALDENCSDASVPSSKPDISNIPKRKSKRRRLLQSNESTDILPLPVDASSTNTDTDLDSYGRSASFNKGNESPGEKSHKPKTVRKLNSLEPECFENRKLDHIDISSSQERGSYADGHLFSKKKSKRSHAHTEHLKLSCNTVSHPSRIIASDDQSPSASPPPSRKFCRSKSVAPIAPKSPSYVSSLSNVPNVSCPMSVEDNTYQPKRIKPLHSKVHGRRISDSQSPNSDSFPTPTYKPSIPVDSPDANNKHNQRRRSRSVHLSSSRRKNESPVEANASELSQDSIGYSPTKRSLINGGSSNIPDANTLPVYHVSHISPSPPPKSKHKNKSSSSQNDLVRSKSSHRSNFKSQSSVTKSSSEVPPFYARWIKEPSSTDRFPSTSSNNSNSKKHQTQW